MDGLPRLVSVGLKFNGQNVLVEGDGFVGCLLETGKAVIRVEVPDHLPVVVFTVDGSKNICLKRESPQLSLHRKLYELTIQVKKGDEMVFYTNYPSNNLRLLEYARQGLVRVYEIALVSQKGDFFLTIQQTYEAQCFRQAGKMVCPHPQLRSWPQMMQLLQKLLWPENLLNICNRQEEDFSASNGRLISGIGQVLWFNLAMGYGALLTSQGVARAHYSEIAVRPRLAFLKKGELVRYQRLDPPRTTKRRTGFRFEAMGVDVLE